MLYIDMPYDLTTFDGINEFGVNRFVKRLYNRVNVPHKKMFKYKNNSNMNEEEVHIEDIGFHDLRLYVDVSTPYGHTTLFFKVEDGRNDSNSWSARRYKSEVPYNAFNVDDQCLILVQVFKELEQMINLYTIISD